MDNIRELIPQNKHDVKRAEAVIAVGYPTIEPILPELLEWLQDYNWPVARVLAPLLLSVGAPLIPHIREIMKTDDEVWKYWMITLMMRNSKDIANAFRDELTHIAQDPTQSEVAEELTEIAQLVLEEYGWA